MNKIPVIGTAIVNGPHWIQRLVNSIDYPTENLVIFDNNGRGELIDVLDKMSVSPHAFIDKISVCHLPANIGCSGAWNMIIKCYMNAPYWIITGHDISFTPGFLEEMIRLSNDEEVGIVHGAAGDFGDGGYELFLIKDWVIQNYGLFDENLYPAYCEDADYIMRLKHKPIKQIPEVGKPFYHGETMNYYESGQQTKRMDSILAEKLNEVNLINFEYMDKKWGEGWHMTWPYYHPFNNGTLPLSTTTYDLQYVRRKHLGF